MNLRKMVVKPVAVAIRIGALPCLIGANTAQALTTFTPNTPARAAEVNANFLELDQRLNALESPASQQAELIDCGANPQALKTRLDSAVAGASFTVSGTCEGPIYVSQDYINLTAQSPGYDGITTPVGNDTEVLAIFGRGIKVTGLLLDGSNNPGINAFVIVNGNGIADNVTAINAPYQFWVGRGGVGKFFNIQNANIGAGDNGWARLYEGNNNIAVELSRSGGMEVRASDINLTQLRLTDSSYFRLQGGRAMTLSGELYLLRGSTASFYGLFNQTSGTLDVRQGSQVFVGDDSTLNVSSFRLDNSEMTLSGGVEVKAESQIKIYNNASLQSWGQRSDGTPARNGIYGNVLLSRSANLISGDTDFGTSDTLARGAIYATDSSSVFFENSTAAVIGLNAGSSGSLRAQSELWSSNGENALTVFGNSTVEVGSGSDTSLSYANIKGNVAIDHNSSAALIGYSRIQGGLRLYRNSTFLLEDYASIAAPGVDCSYDGTIHLHAGAVFDTDDNTTSVSGFLRYIPSGNGASRFEAFGQGASVLEGLRAEAYVIQDLSNNGTDSSLVTSVVCN